MKSNRKSEAVADRKSPHERRAAEAESVAAESFSGLRELRLLQLLVFVSGAVLMGLEIAGSRILAPHFGNSIFVWGSLITIFLTALSAGYYLGGAVADRHPSRMVLHSICVGVSVWIFGIAFLSYGLCTILVGAGFGERGGPLLASTLLFLVPSVGMGMVSPFAIRLGTRSLASVGKTSGTLYALSTVGSIAGTFITTFVLIPSIGLTSILKGLAGTMLLASLATHPWWRSNRGALVGAAAIGLGAALAVAPAVHPYPVEAGEALLVEVETPYQNVSVVEFRRPSDLMRQSSWRHGFFAEGYRALKFDRRYIESAIRLSDGFPAGMYPGDNFYTNYFHLAFLAKPEIKRTVFIGAGGAIGPRSFHLHDPAMEIDVVDIDPKVIELTRTHFYLPAGDGVPIHTFARDGRMFMRTQPDRHYDCVILDAFTIGGRIPFHLVTREFLELCREKMSDDGLFIMNVNSALDGPNSEIYRSMRHTLSAVFPTTYVFDGIDDAEINPKELQKKPLREFSRNAMLIGSNGREPITPEQWSAAAQAYESNSFVDGEIVRRIVADLLPEEPIYDDAPLFTDDYAPIETMSF